MLIAQELRDKFLTYFAQHQHNILPPSSLIPTNDPSLLFTNAGMVQFKDVFLGQESSAYDKVATIQPCIRSGGKHNDLDNVGYTARHHTFFEMLGNFSFGNYFKEDAITYAWEFLTGTLGLPRERLWVTVHQDDHEAADFWLNKIKINPATFSRCNNDNFWAMGDTGPCGPCTEIFYDYGPDIAGSPPSNDQHEGERYVEIWNLVFMQYNRDENGHLSPLTHPCIDTGMGLERLAAVMQGVTNNYYTDLFQPIMQAGLALDPSMNKLTEHERLVALRIMADHIRATAFLIVEGIIPSNEGRGYVLRRIMRRALRQGHRLGWREPFFSKLLPALTKIMADAYPQLLARQELIGSTIRHEEEQFLDVLTRGISLFEKSLSTLSGKIVPGNLVFKLYDTYGFPLDIIGDMAKEAGLSIDMAGFKAAMTNQQERSRKQQQFNSHYTVSPEHLGATMFLENHLENSPPVITILALYDNDTLVSNLAAGATGAVVVDNTPCYAEGGGQIGDSGIIISNNDTVFTITNTIRHGKTYLHLGTANAPLTVGMQVSISIDAERRQAITLNHTATHLLHAALGQVLGPHAQQQGSMITPERLRFDFTHPRPLSATELKQIEDIVNTNIRNNHRAQISHMNLIDAKDQGIIGLFTEKYSDIVRVVNFGSSTELCGGTHVNATGDIGIFKIVTETGIASGIRRIEAVSGAAALAYLEQHLQDTAAECQQLQHKINTLAKTNKQLKNQLLHRVAQQLYVEATHLNSISIIAQELPELEADDLRTIITQIPNKRTIIALISAHYPKIAIAVGVSQDLTAQCSAVDLLNTIMQPIAGKGGGRKDFATGGATLSDPEQLVKLRQSIAQLANWANLNLA